MIKKTLATMMLVSAFTVSSMSFAADLEQNMKTLAKNYKAFNQTTNVAEANKALDNMRVAATDAKKVKLKGRGDASAPTSTQLYDQLIAQIDKTQALVKGGHLDHAKMEGKKLAEIRDQGHKIYH
ncbi:cytochrome b562 [Acinetobacter rongchengensis]|uniref:ATP-binding protein n=1 Tax=Acinetobacter rongchengensis TaxID=2419601 RepID=A0A3A8EQF3_9GAMM|nr:cytochrome b562 [Acinetobacter rongchengensis]RKG36428.1 ATP-binding protein [Acinetobacter rongchengensis]